MDGVASDEESPRVRKLMLLESDLEMSKKLFDEEQGLHVVEQDTGEVLQKEVFDMKMKVAECQSRKGQLIEQRKMATEEIKACQMGYDEYKAYSLKCISQEKKRLQEILDILQERKADVLAKKEGLENQIKVVKQSRIPPSILEEIEELKESSSTLESRLGAKRKNVKRKKGEVQEKRALVEKKKEELKRLQEELQKIKPKNMDKKTKMKMKIPPPPKREIIPYKPGEKPRPIYNPVDVQMIMRTATLPYNPPNSQRQNSPNLQHPLDEGLIPIVYPTDGELFTPDGRAPETRDYGLYTISEEEGEELLEEFIRSESLDDENEWGGTDSLKMWGLGNDDDSGENIGEGYVEVTPRSLIFEDIERLQREHISAEAMFESEGMENLQRSSVSPEAAFDNVHMEEHFRRDPIRADAMFDSVPHAAGSLLTPASTATIEPVDSPRREGTPVEHVTSPGQDSEDVSRLTAGPQVPFSPRKTALPQDQKIPSLPRAQKLHDTPRTPEIQKSKRTPRTLKTPKTPKAPKTPRIPRATAARMKEASYPAEHPEQFKARPCPRFDKPFVPEKIKRAIVPMNPKLFWTDYRALCHAQRKQIFDERRRIREEQKQAFTEAQKAVVKEQATQYRREHEVKARSMPSFPKPVRPHISHKTLTFPVAPNLSTEKRSQMRRRQQMLEKD